MSYEVRAPVIGTVYLVELHTVLGILPCKAAMAEAI